MKKSVLLFLIALLLSSAGCHQVSFLEETESTAYYEWMAGKSPVDDLRLGIEQQGIYGIENSFECTNDGVYFMCNTPDGSTFILYGDHGSDTLIKLCSRADCMHTDSSCDAYVSGGVNICYFDGYLYTMSGNSMAKKLIRMNLDGTNKVTILDTSDIYNTDRYSGTMACMIWNGVLSLCPYKLDAEGNLISDCFYYKLDGSMKSPELADMNLALFNDGDCFLVEKLSDANESQVWLWDANDLTSAYLTDGIGVGYYGTEAVYYARDGVVYCRSYETGEESVLFDSGLVGDYRLICFPDCMILASSEEGSSMDRNLYIYNWEYSLVAQVELDYPLDYKLSALIVGETPERIILSDSLWSIPRYYIQKSDFGTGNIEIHEYNLPDLEEEIAELDAMLADSTE